jgi:hypothetical protein
MLDLGKGNDTGWMPDTDNIKNHINKEAARCIICIFSEKI